MLKKIQLLKILNYKGIKSKKFKEKIKKFKLKSRSSYNENFFKKRRKKKNKKYLKNLGYYFSEVEILY